MRVMAMIHPAALFRMPQYTEVVKADWVRVRRFLAGTWPEDLPSLVTSEVDGVDSVIYRLNKMSEAPYVVIDTEFDPKSGVMNMAGVGAPGVGIAQFTWGPRLHPADRQLLRTAFARLVRTAPVVFQNAFADIPILKQNLQIQEHEYVHIDDTLLAHSVLWCEQPHNLEFMASIYGRHEKLKHLAHINPWLYNAGDVAETLAVWEALRHELNRDHSVRSIYRDYLLPLIPIILESQERGIAVDRDRVVEYEETLAARMDEASKFASAYCGYPINLGSPSQLTWWFTRVEGLKCPNVSADTVSSLRGQFLPFDAADELDMDSLLARVADGAHPLLEARTLYAGAQQLRSHYIEPFLSAKGGRVHAEFHPWAQVTGRWSTVNPPLAQLPHSMRKLLTPDAGWPWIEFDWDQQELRILAALANDEPLLEVFERQWDPHTLNMCDLFGYEYPVLRSKEAIDHAEENQEWRAAVRWTTSDDPRRVFAKRFVYKRIYGGSAQSDIPGAAGLGLDRKNLAEAGRRWDRAHPAVARFWRRLEANVRTAREVRTPLGRRWRLLGHDTKRIIRQAYDFPMQGTSSDIMNRTIADIKQFFGPDCYLVYSMHDSLKIAFRETVMPEARKVLPDIVEQPWDLDGVTVRFPASYEERWA